ncbi:MAG: hypothetical protein ACQ9MH_27465 [Nitrospinales bacterium]
MPKPAHPSLRFSSKLRVNGAIMDPKVSPDKAALLAKGATLLSTLVVGGTRAAGSVCPPGRK